MQRRLRNMPVFIPVFFLALCIYLPSASLYPTGYADSDEFLTMGATFGVAHPSGFPLLVLLTGLAQRLATFTNPAHAGNLLAALLQAASLGLIAQTCSLLLVRKSNPDTRQYNTLIIAGSLLTAVSRHFWQYGAVLEAPSLTNFLITITLYSAIRWHVSSKKSGAFSSWFFLTCFFAGVSLSHIHTTILIYPSLALILWHNRHQFQKAWSSLLINVSLSLGFWLSGFIGPNLLLFYFHSLPNQFSWFFTPTPSGWWHFILRQDYAGYFPEETVSRQAYLAHLGIKNLTAQPEIYRYILENYSLIGLVLILLGLYAIYKNKHRIESIFLLFFIVSGPLFIGYMSVPSFNPNNLEYLMEMGITYRQFMIVHTSSAFILVFGLVYLHSLIATKIKRSMAFLCIFTVCLGLFGYQLVQNWSVGYQRNNRLAQTYAHNMLDQADDHGVIICSADIACFSLAYAQSVEKYRPQVTVLTKNDLYIRSYLQRNPDMFGFTYHDNPFFAANLMAWNLQKRSVYFTNPTDFYIDYIGLDADPFYLVPKGYLFQVVKAVPEAVLETSDYALTQSVLADISPKDLYLYGLHGYLAALHNTTGQLFAYYGDSSLAKKHFNLSLKLFPDFESPKSWLQNSEAFKPPPEYAPGTSINVPDYLDKADELIEKNQLDDGYVYLRKASYLDPKNQLVREKLIKLYVLGGYKTEADQEIKHLQSFDPKYQLPPELDIQSE
jgi:hypothetical protein